MKTIESVINYAGEKKKSLKLLQDERTMLKYKLLNHPRAFNRYAEYAMRVLYPHGGRESVINYAQQIEYLWLCLSCARIIYAN